MNKGKIAIAIALVIVVIVGVAYRFTATKREPLPVLSNALQAELIEYLEQTYQTPEEYVLSKFAKHDLVFIGEYHRILHDVQLIQSLIPQLYAEGVFHLGIEFANYADQTLIDTLITAPDYDEQLAYQIMFNHWPYWGYKEYLDLFKVAWQVNKLRSEGDPIFRVVGLNAITDFSHLKSEADRSNPRIMSKVYPQGDGDTYMAEVILKEFVDRDHKALIYMGMNHAYTKYRQPVYNEQTGEVIHLANNRAGNLVYQRIGERAFTIFLHSPWPNRRGYELPDVYPVDGIIDALIQKLPPERHRAGFDVANTPFSKLESTTSMWKNGYPDFTLPMYADGYIIQGPLSMYRGITVAPGFFTEENLQTTIAQSANPATKIKKLSVAQIIKSMEQDADIPKRFSRFR